MEGPGVHQIAGELARFCEQYIEDVAGTTSEPIEDLCGETITDVRAVKKRIFFETGDSVLIFHFLLYGSYRVNESQDKEPEVEVVCDQDTLRLYNCAIDVVDRSSTTFKEYDRPAEDVLSDTFDKERAVKAITESDRMLADLLLDQSIFGGVGNRIKNEVLWATNLHPKTRGVQLAPETAKTVVEETVDWTTHWYETKQSDESLNSKIYQKDECDRCGSQITKANVGSTSRVTYWCPTCQ